MTISTINRDLAFETFQYLSEEEDVVNCGKVNRHWKQVVKANETKLFSKDFLAIKGARDTFIRTRHLLEAVNREIEALEDYFANPENEVGLVKIGLSSFSFANEECASYQDQMQLRVEKNELLGKLKSDSYRLSCINRVELLTLKNFKSNPEIMKLFGGREEYNKLPIIDIRHIEPVGNYISFISPKDMELVDLKASIMRGFDDDKREFFTIRFSIMTDGQSKGPYCATIFQRIFGGMRWTQGTEEKSLPIDPFIICDAGKTDTSVRYQKLATLISTGMLINSETREVFLLA